MTATPQEKSPLGRLILVIICLAAAGTLVAGVHYALYDLPGQAVVKAPENNLKTDCMDACRSGFSSCISGCMSDMCRYRCEVASANCQDGCTETYAPQCSSCKGTCDGEYAACLDRPGYTEGDCAGIRNTCYTSCPC